MHIQRVFTSIGPWLLAGVLLGLPGAARAQRIDIERPGERDFILDKADMITPEDEKKIREVCDKLLTDKATPIIVVTIESMAAHGGRGMRIETFARLLFDQWGIGHAEINDQLWNTGILLLVSEADRKARIELGAGWGHREDEMCRKIMDGFIILHFRKGEFSQGIVAGVEALDKLGRKLELPTRPRPWWHYGLIVGFVALIVFTIVSLIRRGASGWAWVFWAAVFGILGFLLFRVLASRGRDGGFSGGSFGGGFSGGGGATGSW